MTTQLELETAVRHHNSPDFNGSDYEPATARLQSQRSYAT